MARKQSTESSEGLRQLLERNGIKPTGNSVKDMALAKKILPRPYRNK